MAHTFTEWSVEAVNTRQDGNGPKPQAMSVIGSVWSDKWAYASGISSRTLSSSNLYEVLETCGGGEVIRILADLKTDQTVIPESSLPESKASPSGVKRSTVIRR